MEGLALSHGVLVQYILSFFSQALHSTKLHSSYQHLQTYIWCFMSHNSNVPMALTIRTRGGSTATISYLLRLGVKPVLNVGGMSQNINQFSLKTMMLIWRLRRWATPRKLHELQSPTRSNSARNGSPSNADPQRWR